MKINYKRIRILDIAHRRPGFLALTSMDSGPEYYFKLWTIIQCCNRLMKCFCCNCKQWRCVVITKSSYQNRPLQSIILLTHNPFFFWRMILQNSSTWCLRYLQTSINIELYMYNVYVVKPIILFSFWQKKNDWHSFHKDY